MRISLCICTLNRAESLRATLQAIVRCHPPTCGWEIIIVDNGSTDHTAAVVESFAARLPIRRVVEPRRGLSAARNTAARTAKGEYFVCTDDDTIPDVRWLSAYEAAFSRFPDTDLFGGQIVPILQPPITRWVQEAMPDLGFPFAMRDFGTSILTFDATTGPLPFGANFAVRAAVQRRFPFDLMLGPGAPYFGEETQSFVAMLRAGHRGQSVPDSVVNHIISPERQTEPYLSKWFTTLGKTMAYEAERRQGPLIFGVPRWLWRKRLQAELQYLLASPGGAPRTFVSRLKARALALGEFHYYQEQSRNARAAKRR